jgi:hypothetical protein
MGRARSVPSKYIPLAAWALSVSFVAALSQRPGASRPCRQH